MVHRLSQLANRLLTQEPLLRASLTVPLLLWEAPPKEGAAMPGSSWELTGSNHPLRRPLQGEPMLFELKKAEDKQNAFAMGITVGRTENNDVAIDDASVSRFHAYFQQDPKSQLWRLVDAESSNGTWVGALKLAPNVPAEVADHSRLRFGTVEMRFMNPETFLAYLRKSLAD